MVLSNSPRWGAESGITTPDNTQAYKLAQDQLNSEENHEHNHWILDIISSLPIDSNIWFIFLWCEASLMSQTKYLANNFSTHYVTLN